MSSVTGIEFWLEYMLEWDLRIDHTWEWAFIVCPEGEIIVRHGPFWHETGIYATKRRIVGCEWE